MTFQKESSSLSSGLFASPGVRRLARELDIVPSVITGTGGKGRVTKQDLHSYKAAHVYRLFSNRLFIDKGD